jgi:myo-inositol 2-dehydrogenase / D-chiro-inositol 1-dehydrogenase
MKTPDQAAELLTTRREFLKASGAAVAGAALAASVALPRPGYAAENNTVKVAVVGCGSRGTGAALQALSTTGPTMLWALADVFEHRVEGSLKSLSRRKTGQIDVPPERRFIGFDAFKHAIDSLDKGDVVLLATPPAFRPMHCEYAVQKGVNVFMEKSFAVDAPGIRRVLKAGQMASQKTSKSPVV